MNRTTEFDGIRLLDAKETAAALGISPRTLWSLTNAGRIPHAQIGRRILYRPTDVHAFIESAMVNNRAKPK